MANTIPRKIDVDCRFFLGDRPCNWHKREGVLCRCKHYKRIEQRILIVKLDAMGDVLRTTALLPPLAQEHPESAITWITRPESTPLLEKNPYISEIIPYGPDALVHLQTREFDRVINLDAGKISSALASAARSSRKDGYVLDERGIVHPTNAAAGQWLEMGVFDDLKQAGSRTYQDTMAEILGLAGREHHYVFQLEPEEIAAGRQHLQKIGVRFDRPVIGLNTGGGGRWPLKQWRFEGYVELIKSLDSISPVQFVLLAGPAERDRNERLKQAVSAPLLDSGNDNPVRHFAAMVSFCDLVITGDTLAMHIALALGRRTVVMFGPTSSTEIELYGLGEKVVPDMDCLCCYKSKCDCVPNCMDRISVKDVQEAILRQLQIASESAIAAQVAS
jgi:ADP-heptose:LPS heptosyltransferase